MTTIRLSDFMPYGAPELLESARPRMLRALALASVFVTLVFALAWVLSGVLNRRAHSTVSRDELTRVLLETPPPPAVKVRQPPPPPPAIKPAAPAVRAVRAQAAVPVPVPEREAKVEQTVASQDELRSSTSPPAAASGPVAAPAAPSGDGAANAPGQPALVDQLPEPLNHPQPAYPDLARQAQVEGLVIVYALVGKDGRVKEVQLHPKSNVDMLNTAALETARRWTFKPAMQSGQPVSVWVAVPFRFQLR